MSQFCIYCGSENLDGAKFCKNCGKELYQENTTNEDNQNSVKQELGFTWWNVWAWLGLILGNLMILAAFADIPNAMGMVWGFIIVNTILNILILRYNKYAFLIATILSLNPLYWIINGIYLKNRWCDPKVNNGVRC